MAAPRRARAAKGRIPGTLVMNWQPKAAARSPLARRPKTACEPCRLAKVKCSGERLCSRCSTRRLSCRYRGSPYSSTTSNSAPSPDGSHAPISVHQSGFGVGTLPLNEEPLGFPANSAEGILGANVEWTDEMFEQALEDFNWIFPDTQMTTSEPLQLGDTGSHDTGAVVPQDTLTCSSTTRPLLPGHSLHDRCGCRAVLISHIPQIESALRDRPKPSIEKLLRITGDVLASCEEAARCRSCPVSSVDLVSIITVFQQTACCFNHIARFVLNNDTPKSVSSEVKLPFDGDYTDQRIQLMDLVDKANVLLGTLGNTAQKLFSLQSAMSQNTPNRSPACLNQLNYDYLQQVIRNFQKYFQLLRAKA
ncbi:hypothetical protein BX600DRAFT_215728 [Xylariales sp. PMI_506]|nr:hypothetical protein BX600DRAFT_215728 [Xylariales sp. PMI_506]